MSYIATWVDPFINDVLQRGREMSDTRVPRSDVFETPEAWVIFAEMPGIESKSVDVQVENGVLTITGTTGTSLPENATPLRQERGTGVFRRQFAMDDVRAQTDQVTASLKEGILTVRVPKASPAKTFKVQVAVE